MSKTLKAAKSRLKITATGKVRHFRMGKGHLMVSKSSKRRRRLRQGVIMTGRRAKRFAAFIL